jgi:hypothetical protein
MPDRRSLWEFSMVESDSEPPKGARGGDSEDPDGLPFTVELAEPNDGQRILARAASATLARAIFAAACTEFPNRQIMLKRGKDTIDDSAASA